MPFITQGKTNWKYILILTILIVIVGGGTLSYQYLWLPKEEVKISEVKPSEEITKDETTDWKTYKNEEIGIEFRYPSEWQDVVLRKEFNDILDWAGTVFFSDPLGPEKLFIISFHSKDYRWYDWVILNKKIVDINWSASEFAENMDVEEENVLFTKKLSEKSILVAYYDNSECSPNMFLSVLTPLNQDYPNFGILIHPSFWTNDPILLEQEEIEMKKYGNTCDLLEGYKKIAEKIYNGTYAEELNSYIKTAQLIADSVSVIQPASVSVIQPARPGWKTYYSEKLKIGFSYPATTKNGEVSVKESGKMITLVIGGYDSEMIERRDDKLPGETAQEAFNRLVVEPAEMGLPLVEYFYDPKYPQTLLVLWIGHDYKIGEDNWKILRDSIKIFD